MKVIISAAGTGGHIYPAISIINKIKEMDKKAEFIYIGTTNRMEKDIIPGLGIKYIGLDIIGFSKNIFISLKALIKLIKGNIICKKIIQEFNPDIVIGVGGYVSVPVVYAAHRLGIKTLIHEQNSIPGKANKFLNKYADTICISIKSSINYFDKSKTVYTGNPRAEEMLLAPKITKNELGLNPKKDLVLITMGSLGSKTINEIVRESLKDMENKNYQVLFVTGNKSYDDYKDLKYKNIKIVSYLNNIASVFNITDLIVSRAGATTISEITAIGIPSILIPSPYVPNNHQYFNAKELSDENAAVLLSEVDLNKDRLLKQIDNLINNKATLKKMSENAKKLGMPNSMQLIYKEIKKLTK